MNPVARIFRDVLSAVQILNVMPVSQGTISITTVAQCAWTPHVWSAMTLFAFSAVLGFTFLVEYVNNAQTHILPVSSATRQYVSAVRLAML